LKAKFIPSNALDLVKCKWNQQSQKKRECITEFNELFGRLRAKLEPQQPLSVEILGNAYRYRIEKGNHGVYTDLVHNFGMRDRTPTLEQLMEHLVALDTFLNKYQPGSGPNTTTTTKASARKMDSRKGGITGTVGPAKYDGWTCYNCGQVRHISRNCPNCNSMNTLLEHALVGKDAPTGKSECPCRDKKRGGALTGRKESGRLAENNEAKQEMESKAESELERLSDSDSEAGKGKGGQ
jgi:hypothetical protein